MGRRQSAGSVALPLVVQPLTYQALDWATHPIDLAPSQPHGWGPFSGPWQPVDFRDPSRMISTAWTGDNDLADFGPGYDELTLFHDGSLDSVDNRSFLSVLQDAAEAVHQATASTISQAPLSTGFRRMLGALGIQPGGTS